MNPGELLLGLTSIINSDELEETIFALHLDPIVWDLVSEEGFASEYAAKQGNEAAAWNSGLIGLYSISQESLSEIICTLPLQPISAELRQQASAFYQKALKSNFVPSTSSEATFLALALRERKRLTGNWSGLFSEIARSSNNHNINPETWTTPLSILLAWFPGDPDLLQELIVSQEFLTETEYFVYISTILLSQQSSDVTKKELLLSILQKEDFANQVNWLKQLSSIHPVIAQNLATSIIESYQGDPDTEDPSLNGAYNLFLQDLARQSSLADPLVSEAFDPDFTSLDQWITLFGIANDESQHNALLDYKNNLLKGIQTGIDAYKLRNNTDGLTSEETIVRWRDLAEQSPQSDIAKAEYALALIGNNKTDELSSLLWSGSEEPLVLLTRALIEELSGNVEEAREFAIKAADKCLYISGANNKDIERHLYLLGKLNYLDLSQELLESQIRKEISKPANYRLLAHLKYQMNNHAEAINSANIALTLDSGDHTSRRLLAKLYERVGEPEKALNQWEQFEDTDLLTTEDQISYANCALATNQPDLAVSICQKSITADPGNGELIFTLGEAYEQLGQKEKAAEYYQKAVTISPANDLPWIKLVEIRLADGQNDAMIDLLSTAINACPNSARLSSKLADHYIEEGSYAESVPYLTKSYNLDPKNQTYALKLGSTLQILGQTDEALGVFKDALQHVPDNQEILRAYATTLISCERNEEAISPLLQILETEPDDIAPYLELASIALSHRANYLPQIDIELAIELLERGLKLDSENIHGRLLLAELLAADQREQEAKDIYVSLSENSNLPENLRWRVNYGLGLMSTKLGEVDVALAALEEAGNQNPSNFEIHQKLAETYASANLPKAAVNSAQAALAIAPSDAENLIWYSEFCDKLGDMPEALSSLDAAIKQQPDKAELRLKLGELQLKMKDNEAAKKTFQELVAHGKLNARLIRKLAKTLSQAGEMSEAIHYLEFGIEQDPVSSLPLLLDLVQYEEKNGNLSKAVSSIEKAIAINPDNIELQIINADLLAHAHEYDQAITVLEDTKSRITKSVSENLDSKLDQILLRQVYLNRKNGNLPMAISLVDEALKLYPDSMETIYLGADISFNLLDFSKTGEYLQLIFTSQEEVSKPVRLLTGILDGLLKFEIASEVDASEAIDILDFSDKWVLWAVAANILSRSSKSVKYENDHLFNELAGHHSLDIYEDLPLADFRTGSLPNIDIYNPIISSPSLLYFLLDASLEIKNFKAANAIMSMLEEEYILEPGVQFYKLKLLTLQAETHRYYTLLKIKNNLPQGDALSIHAMDRFSETALLVKRYSEENIIKYWEGRGNAAFQPTIENYERVLDISVPVNRIECEIQKLALENNISELETKIEQFAEKKSLIGFAAAMISDKAPAKAFEFIENNIDNPTFLPEDLAQFALVSYSAGEFELALSSIEKALEQWPNEPIWHSFAAQICQELDNDSSALYHLRIAADLEPENYDAVLGFGEGSLEFGDPMHAIQYLKIASALEPTKYRPWYLLAKTYQSRGDNMQALANIERAVTLAPNSIEPMILSSELSFSNGQIDQSIKKVDAALRIDPKNIDALVLKVQALRAVDQSEEAMKLINYSIKKVSKPLPLLIEKAEIVRSTEGNKAYLVTLQKIADDYPKNAEILRLYAIALAENGHTSEALNITQLTLKLNPEQSDIHILAGRLLRTSGQLDQALDHLSESISQDPGNIEGYLELAKTYQERRDFAKASAVFQQAIEIIPTDYRPYYQLGLLLKDAKDYRGAENMLRKASEFSKDDVNILRQLGAIIAINLVHPA